MSLQYRIRPKGEDDRWHHRIHLSGQFFLQVFDAWLQSESSIPVRQVVAGVLHLYSAHQDPYRFREASLAEFVLNETASPEAEYRSTWPSREPDQAQELIDALEAALTTAVESCDRGISPDECIQSLVQQVAELIVHHQYVVFHHYMTTYRDVNHWGI